MINNFISFDIESENKTPSGIIILSGHYYEDGVIIDSFNYKRKLNKSNNLWVNKFILPKIKSITNNSKDSFNIYENFKQYYTKKQSPLLVTYNSNPYENFAINYINSSSKFECKHFDIYTELPERFPNFNDLEKILKIEKSIQHDPRYDSKVCGDVFLKLLLNY